MRTLNHQGKRTRRRRLRAQHRCCGVFCPCNRRKRLGRRITCKGGFMPAYPKKLLMPRKIGRK